ncbi:MAG: CoA-binding protein [Nitrososphaerales archaeon]|nr:CoA-binding protein [Nitrososphaerales archaeon]
MGLTEGKNGVAEVLGKYRNIAAVGLSRDPEKDGHSVAKYLKSKGYRIVPINPFANEILGEKCYKTLLDLTEDIKKSIEIVDIFRPSQDVPPIVEQAIKLKEDYGRPLVIWMQEGIVNEDAARMAREAGLVAIMDRCMKIEHRERERALKSSL